MQAFGSHRLQSSPLCLSVPLDGTELVRGLHALERSAVVAPPSPLASSPAPRTSRYKGPRLRDLTLADLQGTRRPWEEFVGWDSTCIDAAYNIPHDLDCLADRVESNLVHWAPNYLRLAVAVVLLTFYLRPVALLGVAVLALWLRQVYRVGFAEARASPPRGADAVADADEQATALRAAQADRSPTGQAGAVLLAAAAWLAMTWTRCLPIAVLGCGLGGGAVLSHATLRRPHRSSGRGPAPPGWSFAQAAGLAAVAPGAEPRLALHQAATAAGRYCGGVVGRARRHLDLAVRHWWSARRLSGR